MKNSHPFQKDILHILVKYQLPYPPLFEKLIQPQSKTDIETIQPQLEYNPTSPRRAKMVLLKISIFLSINISCCTNQLWCFLNAVRKGHIKIINIRSIKKWHFYMIIKKSRFQALLIYSVHSQSILSLLNAKGGVVFELGLYCFKISF